MTLADLFIFDQTQSFKPTVFDQCLAPLIEAGTIIDQLSLTYTNAPVLLYRAPNQTRHQEKRLGAVLAKHTDLDSDQIILFTALAEFLLSDLTLDFIADTDPDAWVQVYADGRQVESCMTPEPGEWVVYDPATPRKTPLKTRSVKTYAAGQYLTSAPEPYRSQKLALAVLYNTFGEVVARAVVNEKTKQYASCYGSYILARVLNAHGYNKNSYALLGCVLRTTRITTVQAGERLAPNPRHAFWLCPYLDGCQDLRAITFGGERFFEVVEPDDDWDVSVSDYCGKIEFNGEWNDVG